MAAMNNYTAHENQSLQDISAHVYGRADMAVALALLNNISLTDYVHAGQLIKLVEAPVNTLVTKSVDSRKLIPATELNEQQKNELPANFGIGKMAIGSTFIIR